MDKLYTTKSFEETQKLGEDFAIQLCLRQAKESRKTAVVIGLSGNLGGGKTTFLQGFAKELGIKEKILSPTFVVQKRFGNFYHIDCYRLKNYEDILELGWKEIIKNPKNIVAVEWPEIIKKVLPKNTIFIEFKFIDEQTRELTIRDKMLT